VPRWSSSRTRKSRTARPIQPAVSSPRTATRTARRTEPRPALQYTSHGRCSRRGHAPRARRPSIPLAPGRRGRADREGPRGDDQAGDAEDADETGTRAWHLAVEPWDRAADQVQSSTWSLPTDNAATRPAVRHRVARASAHTPPPRSSMRRGAQASPCAATATSCHSRQVASRDA